jgi:hypothetical protein
VAITVKAPADLHEGLRRWAAEEERSLAGQVLFILRRALEAHLAEREQRAGRDPGRDAPGASGGDRPG